MYSGWVIKYMHEYEKKLLVGKPSYMKGNTCTLTDC